MTDYIKREDAINTIRNAFTGMTADTLELRTNDIPSAGVAPVVRCKDCVSFHYSGMGGDNGITYCAPMGIEMQPTDFCSYGERKDND